MPQLGAGLKELAVHRPFHLFRLAAGVALALILFPLPLAAQHSLGRVPLELFVAHRFDELDGLYSQVLAARSRNQWGEFHTEEFMRHLDLSLTGARVSGVVLPTRQELDAHTKAWINHSPRSMPAAIARATYLLQGADTLYRGRKWADGEVLTREAQGLLLNVRVASRTDPAWHAAWLYVAKQQGWDPRQIMEAAEAAADGEPRALGPWMTAAAALSPDGSGAGLLRPLADLAVRKSKATEGQALYARIYLQAARTYRAVHYSPFTGGGLEWPKMNVALIDLYTRYPEPGVLNQHAALACIAGERGAAAALIKRIGPNPDAAWWKFWGGVALYDRCKAWASSGSI
jgi:hypothetical protein